MGALKSAQLIVCEVQILAYSAFGRKQLPVHHDSLLPVTFYFGYGILFGKHHQRTS